MFYGITIRMYNNNEHNPPHFHALYQGHKAVINMEGEMLEGDMPGAQLKLVQAWVIIHHDELLADRELAISEEPLYKIEPLK